jgi:hypothetical protein
MELVHTQSEVKLDSRLMTYCAHWTTVEAGICSVSVWWWGAAAASWNCSAAATAAANLFNHHDDVGGVRARGGLGERAAPSPCRRSVRDADA